MRRIPTLVLLAGLLLCLPVPPIVMAETRGGADLGVASGEDSPAMMAGWVEVEAAGDRVVVIVDRGDLETRPDGLADLVAVLSSGEPARSHSFAGQALVEVSADQLRVVPLGPEEAMVLGVVGKVGPGEAGGVGGEARRWLGIALVTLRDLPPSTLREARNRAREAVTVVPAGPDAGPSFRAAPMEPETQHDDPSGSGGCASSCSITCAGGGGSCNASCSDGYCADCSCGTANLASCRCRAGG